MKLEALLWRELHLGRPHSTGRGAQEAAGVRGSRLDVTFVPETGSALALGSITRVYCRTNDH